VDAVEILQTLLAALEELRVSPRTDVDLEQFKETLKRTLEESGA